MKTQNSKLKTQNRVRLGQNHNLKLKTFPLCVLTLLFTLCTLHLSGAYAVDVTTQAAIGSPSASPSATPTDEKVQEIRDVVQEKVQEKIQEIKDKIEKKGYVGILKEMTDSTLTIETLTGEKMVTVDSQANIVGANKKEIKLKDLEIDQKIICMGTLDENNILVAKRIVVVLPPTKPVPQREVFFGKIAEIDTKLKTINLTHLKKIDKTFLAKVNEKTVFSDGAFKDLKVEQIITVITSKTKKNETPTALLIKSL